VVDPDPVQCYVRSLRAFCRWLHREGYSEENVLAPLKPPKAPQKLVEILADEEVARMLASIDANSSSGWGDMKMAMTFLDSGPRLSELIGLRPSDAHLDEGCLKVMGKGSSTE